MTPAVRLVDGQLVIEWPDPTPSTFEIASDLFSALVDEINTHRRNAGTVARNAAAVAAVLRSVSTTTGELADRLAVVAPPVDVPAGSPAVLSTITPG